MLLAFDAGYVDGRRSAVEDTWADWAIEKVRRGYLRGVAIPEFEARRQFQDFCINSYLYGFSAVLIEKFEQRERSCVDKRRN